MLIKTGDSEMISVIDPYEIEDEDQRKSVLATALEKAKDKVSAKKIQTDKMEL
jgi:hypothetical protein